MDLVDFDDLRRTPPPLYLSSKQREILDDLCLCHEKGPGPHQGNIRVLRVIWFLACCLAISAGSVVYASQIPPLCSALVAGFIVGVIFTITRQQINFQRYWPLFESIIDWKFVERLRKNPDMSGEDNV